MRLQSIPFYLHGNGFQDECIYIYIYPLPISVHLMDVKNNSLVSFGKLELPTFTYLILKFPREIYFYYLGVGGGEGERLGGCVAFSWVLIKTLFFVLV